MLNKSLFLPRAPPNRLIQSCSRIIISSVWFIFLDKSYLTGVAALLINKNDQRVDEQVCLLEITFTN